MPLRPVSLKALAVSAALVLPGAALAQDAPTADTVVATVNGIDITLGQLIIVRAGIPPEYQNLTDDVLFDGILDQLIQQTAVAGTAPETLPRRIQLALDNQLLNLMAAEALEDVAEAAVTDAALQAAYDDQIAAQPGVQEFNASHILVDTEAEANDLVTALEGGADFAELAKEKSTGPSGPNGGELGWFGKGAMVPAFEEAVIGLEVGQISAPVQTQFGWHVVILNDVREQPKPTLDEVRDQLADEIRETAVRAHIDAKTSEATVTRTEAKDLDASVISNLDLLEQ